MYLYVVLGMSPISLGVQVTQLQMVLLAKFDLRHSSSDLPGDKGLTWEIGKEQWLKVSSGWDGKLFRTAEHSIANDLG